jgi:hypothetical protein
LEPEKESSLPVRSSPSLLGLLGILVSSLAILRLFSKRKVDQSNQPCNPQTEATEKCRYVPVVIADSKSNAISTENSKEESGSRDPGAWDKAVTIAQVVLAFVTCGLLIVNFGQMRSTETAANAAKESADLNHDLHEGIEAARISILRIEESGYGNAFSITISNLGKIASPQVDGRFTITAVSLPDQRDIGSPISEVAPFSRGEVMPDTDNGGENSFRIPFTIPDVAGRKERITNLKETLRLKGGLVYQNGFRRTITDTPCWEYVPAYDWQAKPPNPKTTFNWVNCADAAGSFKAYIFRTHNE